MSNVNFSQLTVWSGSIDATNDIVAIWKTSNGTLYRANQQQLLNIASQPVGISDTQTLTNKTLSSGNVLNPYDDQFTLYDHDDPTRRVQFQVDHVASGVLRTLTIPNIDGTITLLGATQTLTNKTLTSPTINAPTITNANITADAITGFTTANTGTVYGLSIVAGKPTLPDASVLPKNLVTGTGSTWAWQSYTPTWANLVVTSSTVVAKYIQIGKTVFFRFVVVLGGSNAPTGVVSVSLPVTSAAYAGNPSSPRVGVCQLLDSGNVGFFGSLGWVNTTTAVLYAETTSGTYAEEAAVSDTVPFTFGVGDEIHGNGFYEAA